MIVIGLWYIVIGMIIALLIGRAAIKYQKEIGEEIGEEVRVEDVKVLMIVTVITWPKKVFQFTRSIIRGIKSYVQSTQRQEG